ncbi:hypothetical protein ACLQ24_14690 [Micromonospora sp. DT4]|uniref:hypothetical protein n=1 Tax=Micromonospora sp. DT4 TaxID=3393438 RepID=UPI003CF15006
MSTLPTLPTCPEPATIRIELYSANSLDACAYTCVDHTIRATAAAARAGLEAHLIGMAPDVVRPCGHVFAFPTGTLADAPSAVAHPRWCDRDDCQRRGRHHSRVLGVNTDRPEPFTLRAHLVQGLHPAAQPMVRLEDSAATRLHLSTRQTRILRHRLARLLALAGAGRTTGGATEVADAATRSAERMSTGGPAADVNRA